MASDPIHALFEHDLSSMYDGELVLAEVLGRLGDDTAPSEASDAFRAHIAETERHAEILVRCFTLLDVPTRRVPNHAMRGLARDYDLFVAESLPRETLIPFALGSAARAEQLEIASYITLLRQAHALGTLDIAYYLAENLRVEQMTARKLERIADALVRDTGSDRGRDADEFRWSYYTEMVVQTPMTLEEAGSTISPDDLPVTPPTRPAPPAVTQWRPRDARR